MAQEGQAWLLPQAHRWPHRSFLTQLVLEAEVAERLQQVAEALASLLRGKQQVPIRRRSDLVDVQATNLLRKWSARYPPDIQTAKRLTIVLLLRHDNDFVLLQTQLAARLAREII